MLTRSVTIILVLCSVNLLCMAQEWQNYIDVCGFRDMFMTFEYDLNGHIDNKNLSVIKMTHNSLGLFTCLVYKNPDLQYKTLELMLSDEAYKRKIESNACRTYPLRNDFNETFDISNKQEVRIVTYKPVSSPFPMQSITSIKLDGVEQVFMPSAAEIREAESVITACKIHATSNRFRSDCEYEKIFKIFKIKINDKLVWCYVQNEPSAKQIDFDLSNNNYKLYETYPRVDVINNIKNNYVIVNAKNNVIRDIPRVVAIHQKDIAVTSTSISFVRVNSKLICQTPLVEKTINCGRPPFEVVPFDDTVYPDEQPWIVFVYHNENDWKLVCEGTLIDHETIITGASCVMDPDGVEKIDAANIRILLNKYNKAESTPINSLLAVRKIIISEHYNKEYYENDVALLKLKKPFTSFPNSTTPICTTNNINYFVDQIGVVTGFGLNRKSKPLTELSQAHVQRLRPDVCRRRDGYFRVYLNENTYCAEYVNGTNICPEMGGSGLYVKIGDVWFLSGIVTIGVATSNRCSLSAISLYTDISSLHGFIEANRS